ncbi:MAG: hypothetical protein Q9213_002783 [Squamulea squamosa]
MEFIGLSLVVDGDLEEKTKQRPIVQMEVEEVVCGKVKGEGVMLIQQLGAEDEDHSHLTTQGLELSMKETQGLRNVYPDCFQRKFDGASR